MPCVRVAALVLRRVCSIRRFSTLLVRSTRGARGERWCGRHRTACMSTLPAPGVVLTRNEQPVPCELTSGAWLAAAPRGALR
jgi:hypothetical protein